MKSSPGHNLLVRLKRLFKIVSVLPNVSVARVRVTLSQSLGDAFLTVSVGLELTYCVGVNVKIELIPSSPTLTPRPLWRKCG